MIFLKRLLWSALTNVFAAWIILDVYLSSDLNTGKVLELVKRILALPFFDQECTDSVLHPENSN